MNCSSRFDTTTAGPWEYTLFRRAANVRHVSHKKCFPCHADAPCRSSRGPCGLPSVETWLCLHLRAAYPVRPFPLSRSPPHSSTLQFRANFSPCPRPFRHDTSSITNNSRVSFGLWSSPVLRTDGYTQRRLPCRDSSAKLNARPNARPLPRTRLQDQKRPRFYSPPLRALPSPSGHIPQRSKRKSTNCERYVFLSCSTILSPGRSLFR